ncbi:hypothetical protein GCM10023196_056800 [Actinoallomurus vinaceus]|uniref:Uncharacterized protein n=1 Tax=Actinoallomurus vinaceus TaxID=1080074 RepID=A0ABP8UFE5_9ACTN
MLWSIGPVSVHSVDQRAGSYLHRVDDAIPVEKSWGGLSELEGKLRALYSLWFLRPTNSP